MRQFLSVLTISQYSASSLSFSSREGACPINPFRRARRSSSRIRSSPAIRSFLTASGSFPETCLARRFFSCSHSSRLPENLIIFLSSIIKSSWAKLILKMEFHHAPELQHQILYNYLAFISDS